MTEPGCLFCSLQTTKRVVEELDTVFAIADKFPVSRGHHLIIPKRHADDFFSMTDQEQAETVSMLNILKVKLLSEDRSITGFNIGMNCGVSAGQTIFHAHTHLIPRRDGDTEEPKGGVRGVIPEKMGYGFSGEGD